MMMTVYRAGAGPSRSSAQPSPAAGRQHRKLQTNLELGMAPPAARPARVLIAWSQGKLE